MMRALIAVEKSVSERLAEQATDAGHDATTFTDDVTADKVASRIRSGVWDVAVVSGCPDALTADVIDACDSRGILLAALVDNADSENNARKLGVSEIVTPWQSWSDVVRVLSSSHEPHAPETKHPGSQILQDRPPEVTAMGEISTEETGRFGSAVNAISQTASGKRVIAVWGPTGAPGRTSIAVNLAALAVNQRQRTLLIDADTYGGAVAIRLGIFDEAPGIARACRIAAADALDAQSFSSVVQSVHVNGRQLDVMTGILGSSRWPEISRERFERVLEVAERLYDTVIIDVGFSLETDEEVSSDMLAPRRNAATLVSLRRASHLIAVAGADSVGLSRFIRLWSDLGELSDAQNVTVVVNYVAARREGPSVQTSITSAFSRFAGIEDVVLVPRSADLFARADVRGEPPVIIDPSSSFSTALREIARRTLGESAQNSRRRIFERRRLNRLLG